MPKSSGGILSKPIGSVSLADLEALVAAQARETNELEFKGALSFRPTKGQPETADRWIEKGDRVGDLARNEILAEMLAFANADGGTLILGLHESKTEPRVAERLEALPRCEALAHRLLDAAEDLAEPRLPMLAAQPVVATADGGGYVILRVAKSHSAPHRLRSTREFYIRRGERAAVMDVREIKDLTLNLAQSGDRIEGLFQAQRANAVQAWASIAGGRQWNHGKACLIRVTAVPLIARSIPRLTSRRDLWWFSRGFDNTINGRRMSGSYPSREFTRYAKPRIRSFEMVPEERHNGPSRLLRGDGVVEFTLMHALRLREDQGTGTDIYFGWLAQLAAGTLCQIETLRQRLGWGEVPYGLEVEIRGLDPLTLLLGGNKEESEFGRLTTTDGVLLPRIEVGGPAEFDDILSTILLDTSNAFREHWETTVTAPWDALLPPT